jgi:hypothetical protein
MRAHNVIIISSGASNEAPPETLDHLIRSILAAKKQPILVLGPDGDEILANCSEVENCELVFDPNFAGGFFSGVKAGLHATHGAAFIVPLRAPAVAQVAVSKTKFSTLLSTLEESVPGDGTAFECDVICPAAHDDATALSRSENVFLVTQKGVQSLRTVPAQTDWETFENVAIERVRI